ncbi:hypothetical protein [Nannocystis pusilla]|uniref:hypothetical protein n=1 Tax=Nannocystis pusilla TaxID=889268 RepID=UPI003B7813C9
MPTQGQYSQDQILGVLQLLAENPAALQQMLRCAQQYPEVQRQLNQAEDRCRTMQTKCDSLEAVCRTLDMLVRSFLCPGNVNFSQRTLDEYSGKSQIKLVEIVKDLGDPFVNAFPIPPGKKIKLTHKSRPGYTPTEIRIDMNIAGNGNNYSDFTVQFYLQPLNLDIGDEYDGNIFLNKDGTQIAVPFPEYRGAALDIGSQETLSVVISNNSAANNLNSAHVNIFYDNSRFYELCKKKCSGACAVTPPQ